MITEQQGPTRSQQTNQIIETCQAAMSGAVPEQAFRDALAARKAGLNETCKDFSEKVAAEGDKAVQMRAPQIQAVMDAFEAYATALDALGKAFTAKSAKGVDEAVQALGEAIEAWFFAMNAYQTVCLSEGPSEFPAVNILINISSFARARQMEPQVFRSLLATSRQYFETWQAQMEQAKVEEVGDVLDLWKKGLAMHVAGVAEMDRFVDDGNEQHLDQGLAMATEAHGIIKDAFETTRREQFEKGPTKSELANTFIRASQMVAKGGYSPDAFKRDLDQFEQHVRTVRADFDKMCQAQTTSVAIQEEIPRALEAFDLHQEAIASWRKYYDTQDASWLEKGAQQLAEATNNLEKSKAVFETAADRQGMVLCPRCGASNDGQQRMCSSCNATLPRVHQDSGTTSTVTVEEGGRVGGGGEMVMTENLKRILDDTQKVEAGSMSHEDYAATLDWMEGIINKTQSDLAGTKRLKPEDFPEEERVQAEREAALVDETIGLLYQGTEKMREGVTRLRVFLEDGDKMHLQEGARTFYEGSQMVYQVQRIGETARRAVDEPNPHAVPMAKPVDDDEEGSFNVES